jgi:hypothetical protein
MMQEGRRLEMLAERLRGVEPVSPSPAAKIRGWNLVAASVEQSRTLRKTGSPLRRLVLAPLAAALLLVAGGVAASANSLPDSPLYPVKGLLEQARGQLAFSAADRLNYHLELAQARLTEATAMIASHRIDLAGKALSAMDDQLQDAASVVAGQSQTSPALAADLQNRLEQAIAVHDRQLAGLQGQVSNPTAQQAIVEARDRAAQALESLTNPSGDGNGNNGSASPGQGQGQGQGQGPSNKPSQSPHPTPKK